MHNCIKHVIRLSNTAVISCTCTVADKKDMFILGSISACLCNGPTTECNRRKVQADRQKCRSTYYFMSRFVCAKAFVRLVGISPDKLYALAKHYKTNGPVPRQLRAGGWKNNTASLALVDTEHVVHFIKQYAEAHAVSLPGRVLGFKRDDIRLLPSSCPKSQVYRLYKASANAAGHRVVAASTFKKLWLELCPFIVVARPVTDLCWRCQQNNTNIYRSANLTLEEKGELLQEHAAHLSQVDAEWQFYKRQVEESKECVCRNGLVALQPTPANSQDLAMHYSFDFAQQVHYPSNAAQPGPMYFMTARKCAIFGVCCEGFPKQVNYLVDECVNCSKGSNGVISYLHHFFESFGIGEKTVHLHCNNCSGQNKNRYVLWYFLWRVMRGLHTEVTMNFMPAGHTKFAPDWCFGLLKRRSQSLPQTGVLDCSSDVSDERKPPAWMTSVMLSLRAPQLPRSTFHSLLGGKMEPCMSTLTTGRPTLHQSSNLCRASRRLRISDSQLIIPERFSTRPTWRKKRAGWTFWRAETHLESLVPCRTSYVPLDCPENDSSTYSARSGNSFRRTRGMWCAPTQATNLQPEWQHSSGQFAWPVNLLIVLNFFIFVFVSLSLLCSQLLLCCTLYSFVMF